MELADREFNNIAYEIDKISTEVKSQTQKGNYDIKINSTSFSEYFKNRFTKITNRFKIEEFFKKYGIDATFVGHPILDLKREETPTDKKSIGLDENRMTIALLPGSRNSEIKKVLPIMLKAASLISKEKNVQFVLSENSSVDNNIYEILHSYAWYQSKYGDPALPGNYYFYPGLKSSK